MVVCICVAATCHGAHAATPKSACDSHSCANIKSTTHIFVSPRGHETGTGQQGSPLRLLCHALLCVEGNGTISVQASRQKYTQTVNLVVNKTVHIQTYPGDGDYAILDAQGAGRVLDIGANTTLEGGPNRKIKITGGNWSTITQVSQRHAINTVSHVSLC